ncbi:MAG: hypothetical protein PVG45_10290, partial [Gammaproteobacteria bacterium]
MNTLSKVIMPAIVILLSASNNIHADQVKPLSDIMNTYSFQKLSQSRESIDTDMQSCELDNIAVVTIYSSTGKAQVGIDVKVDGNPVGSLSTHFPDSGPECKTPSSDGIITIVIPAGKHTLEAESINLIWPAHT